MFVPSPRQIFNESIKSFYFKNLENNVFYKWIKCIHSHIFYISFGAVLSVVCYSLSPPQICFSLGNRNADLVDTLRLWGFYLYSPMDLNPIIYSGVKSVCYLEAYILILYHCFSSASFYCAFRCTSHPCRLLTHTVAFVTVICHTNFPMPLFFPPIFQILT